MTENRSGFVVLNDSDAAHPELAHWHGNLGDPVALDLGTPLARKATVIDVLSWNLAIGRARLDELVEKIRAGVFDGEERSSSRPLIILAQEAYRSDTSVPAALKSVHHGGKAPRNSRHDIVEIAHALNLSLRYAPSMRNGHHRSDRGNAILSSVSITHARFFPLPHVRQLRVAVAAEVHGLPWLTFASAHLDTRGRTRDGCGRGRYGSGRTAQADALAKRFAEEWGTNQTVVVGADLNTYLGTREPLLRALAGHGFERMPHRPPRSHTFHAPPLRMVLDHLLVLGAERSLKSIRVQRLDEDERDRGRYIFGSDHHPLLARIELAAQNRRIRRASED
ncbi:MAG: endonuclease/exonuclease/phosphatase family protein [Gemmatimonadota bacterium]